MVIVRSSSRGSENTVSIWAVKRLKLASDGRFDTGSSIRKRLSAVTGTNFPTSLTNPTQGDYMTTPSRSAHTVKERIRLTVAKK